MKKFTLFDEIKTAKSKLFYGNCLDKLTEIADNSIELILTDPPYELGFMGKSWDKTGIANNVEIWKECLRVLKPGGYLLSFGGTRTYHRMACVIEDAGFDIRDMIEWVYGSGFPKSLNIGKAVDKLQKNKREVIGEYKTHDIRNAGLMDRKSSMTVTKTKGNSEWEGWGTALKPAHEPICVARKPIEKGLTVAQNVLKWGTGGLNIDASRVEYTGKTDPRTFGGKWKTNKAAQNVYEGGYEGSDQTVSPQGRFPANLIHDGSNEVVACFPEQKSGAMKKAYTYTNNGFSLGKPTGATKQIHESSSGSASRFFKSIIYQAKASRKERESGLEELEDKDRINYGGFHSEKGLITNNRNPKNRKPAKNIHPTVKPIALMEYLITMFTKKEQTVLDPFMGSGTTGIAAKNLNRNFIGIELNEEYFEIAKKRINNA